MEKEYPGPVSTIVMRIDINGDEIYFDILLRDGIYTG
jgi:hypothetical protein